MRNQGLKRLAVYQWGVSICFILAPQISSSTGSRWFQSISTTVTAKPASTSAVAARITRTSVRAVPKTCIHTLMDGGVVAGSLLSVPDTTFMFLRNPPCLSTYMPSGFLLVACLAGQDIHHRK